MLLSILFNCVVEMQMFIATVITRALLASASEHTFSWCILPTAFCPPCWVIPLQLLLLLLLLLILLPLLVVLLLPLLLLLLLILLVLLVMLLLLLLLLLLMMLLVLLLILLLMLLVLLVMLLLLLLLDVRGLNAVLGGQHGNSVNGMHHRKL